MIKKFDEKITNVATNCKRYCVDMCMGNLSYLKRQEGQGTTEYAILVGVLVVIAIVAIVAFKDKVKDLWQGITDGMNSL